MLHGDILNLHNFDNAGALIKVEKPEKLNISRVASPCGEPTTSEAGPKREEPIRTPLLR